MGAIAQQFSGPGFVSVLLDVPFPISIPNAAYLVFDPEKGIAAIEVSLREGSRAFFRDRPIQGPTSFTDLRQASASMQRLDQGRSYLMASRLPDGTQKATLNLHTGQDGGFSECKYFSQMSVTFLADDIGIISGRGNEVEKRAFQIINPFLDKYRLINEDYRISPISGTRNFYLAVCHTSPLTLEERPLSPTELFNRLSTPRTFFNELGHGAANILRTNSYELLGPRSQLSPTIQTFFDTFVQENYEMPLSYALIVESLANLQRTQDYRLAIIHAETGYEVHVVDRLLKLMIEEGMTRSDAASAIETDRAFWGVKNKIRQLDSRIQSYSSRNGLAFSAFVGTPLYLRWENDLYKHRNAAVHAGVNAFTYDQAHTAIGTAKECIVAIESRVPTLGDRIQLNTSMTGFRQNPGEVMF
ncbi:MAG: hypothetical protein ABR953_05070 [Candidatus Acidiferrales bacterium]